KALAFWLRPHAYVHTFPQHNCSSDWGMDDAQPGFSTLTDVRGAAEKGTVSSSLAKGASGSLPSQFSRLGGDRQLSLFLITVSIASEAAADPASLGRTSHS